MHFTGWRGSAPGTASGSSPSGWSWRSRWSGCLISLGDNTNDNLTLPGTGSQHATDTLAKSFPDQANGTSPIVLHVSNGKLTDSKYASAVNQAAADVAKAPDVASVVNPLTSQGASALSKDQATGYLSVTLSVSPGAAVEG